MLVTGRKSKSDGSGEPVLGLFHRIPEECATSLVAMSKQLSSVSRKDFEKALNERRHNRVRKLKALEAKEEEKSRKAGLDAFFLHKQYFSPACWKTVDEARAFYNQLTTKKERLESVKEQILIRYIGLGWEEAHHPWSFRGRAFTPDELFEHLIEVVIPLQDSKEIPLDPPVDLPKIGDDVVLGTLSAGRKRLDDAFLAKKRELRKNIKEDVRRLEDEGEMDVVEYMQQKVWPLERILAVDFRLQICWKYYDGEDGITETLKWCTGTIVSVINDKSEKHNRIEVEVLWDNEFVEPGMLNPTREMLKKRDFNPSVHYHGAWREDLDNLREVEYI